MEIVPVVAKLLRTCRAKCIKSEKKREEFKNKPQAIPDFFIDVCLSFMTDNGIVMRNFVFS